MPEQKVINRARADERAGKSPSTQAGEFVREEFHHIRAGKHGARSPQQAIAIGLSKARRAGVKLPAPKSGPPKIRRQAERDMQHGQHPISSPSVSQRRSRAVLGALKHEGHEAASTQAISRQSRRAASRRSPAMRSNAALRAVHTKGRTGLAQAARKAARTRKSK
jgi:Family of unknown function (DUF6496)